MSNQSTLKACALFKGFSETGLILVGKVSREREIPAGTPIFVENMVGESLFVIKTGIVRLSMKASDGRDVVMDKITAGESFGELGLLIGGQRLVTATAETDCELLELPRRDFAQLQKQKPQTCLKLMINVVSHFGKKIGAAKEYLKPLLLSQIEP